MRPTSGMYAPHSRIASPWQAACCAGVPCAEAGDEASTAITPVAMAKVMTGREMRRNILMFTIDALALLRVMNSGAPM